MNDQSRLLLANQQMTAIRHMHMARSALRRMDETMENLLKLGAISAKEYAPLHLDAMRYINQLTKMAEALTTCAEALKKAALQSGQEK